MDETRFLPLYDRIDALLARQERVLLVLDGRCASGKTTLAAVLERRYGAAVIHLDDFFLRPEQRTPERRAEPGGNVDYERFAAEVAPFLKGGQAFVYRRYDCGAGALGSAVEVPAARLTVVEGCYGHNPKLGLCPDLAVFMSVSPGEQERRIRLRNGEGGWENFRTRWIPLEERYFAAFSLPAAEDVLL